MYVKERTKALQNMMNKKIKAIKDIRRRANTPIFIPIQSLTTSDIHPIPKEINMIY